MYIRLGIVFFILVSAIIGMVVTETRPGALVLAIITKITSMIRKRVESEKVKNIREQQQRSSKQSKFAFRQNYYRMINTMLVPLGLTRKGISAEAFFLTTCVVGMFAGAIVLLFSNSITFIVLVTLITIVCLHIVLFSTAQELTYSHKRDYYDAVQKISSVIVDGFQSALGQTYESFEPSVRPEFEKAYISLTRLNIDKSTVFQTLNSDLGPVSDEFISLVEPYDKFREAKSEVMFTELCQRQLETSLMDSKLQQHARDKLNDYKIACSIIFIFNVGTIVSEGLLGWALGTWGGNILVTSMILISLGGLLSVQIAISKPRKFSRGGLVS